jgi:hypothetical protein
MQSHGSLLVRIVSQRTGEVVLPGCISRYQERPISAKEHGSIRVLGFANICFGEIHILLCSTSHSAAVVWVNRSTSRMKKLVIFLWNLRFAPSSGGAPLSRH